MAITVTPTYQSFRQDQPGPYVARAALAISGLTASADNTVPHGLPRKPQRVVYVPRAAGGWNEKQDADATNLYITVAASGPTSFVVYVDY
jgi:hypothetical protein